MYTRKLMKESLYNTCMRYIFLTLLFLFFLLPVSVFAQETPQQEILEGQVVSIPEQGKETFQDQLVNYQILEVQITRGSLEGDTIKVKNSEAIFGMQTTNYETYTKGEKVRVQMFKSNEGDQNFAVTGRVKRGGLLALVILFVFVVIVVGQVWGVLSLVGLAASFLVIFQVIIPLIMRGFDPIIASIIGSLIIIPITFYISHGWNKKTHVGVVATLIALIITGLLSIYFVKLTHLTGFASEEAGFVQVETQGNIDIKGLLLAGIIIGTLGALDDITVGQASVIQQIQKAHTKITFTPLFKQAMKVGQDHISSMVNTLVLVYSGASLPLLLLFFDSQHGFIDIIELEVVAEEIVRMLVGSVGLVLAAPLATALAAFIFTRGSRS